MVGEGSPNAFLIQIDASSFAEFQISELEIPRVDCMLFVFLPGRAVDEGASPEGRMEQSDQAPGSPHVPRSRRLGTGQQCHRYG